ncbi:MAG: 2-hydroxyacyl-CoA dehydratase family protein, partial [Chloroflexi bacterium]|nr:2-hydroxyacyl-CoA dehydratase family protein [Chloroflexota bacterium]
IRDWQSRGKKVVGFFCSYVPEEILYAGGILPYRVRATNCPGSTALADVYVSHLNCAFMRSCLQFAYEGRYEFLDGFVFTDSCDHIRRLYDVMRETGHFPFMYLIGVPHKVGEEAVGFYKGEIARFRDAVEKAFGVELTEDGLRDAMDVYAETR